jgi:purine-binding chemotaxis protein CheW
VIDVPVLAEPGPAPIPDAPPAPALRGCLVRLGESLVAFDIASTREVSVFEDLTAVPRGPRHLLGVANLRGAIMPVIDVRPLLGLPAPRPARGATALVIVHGSLRAAVMIDAALGIEPFARVLPPTAPPGDRNGIVRGVVRWAGEPILLLDAARILDALRPRRLDLTPPSTEGD